MILVSVLQIPKLAKRQQHSIHRISSLAHAVSWSLYNSLSHQHDSPKAIHCPPGSSWFPDILSNWREGWQLKHRGWKTKAEANKLKHKEFLQAYAEAVLQAKSIFWAVSMEAAKSCPKELSWVVKCFVYAEFLQPAMEPNSNPSRDCAHWGRLLKHESAHFMPANKQPAWIPGIYYIRSSRMTRPPP